MFRPTPLIVGYLALATAPFSLAQNGPEIEGFQLYQDWSPGFAPGGFGDLETGAFSDALSVDAVGQKGSRLLYYAKPERFWWITEVASSIVDFAVVPGMAPDGTDAILASPTAGSGLSRFTWAAGGNGFDAETVLDATWVGADHLDAAADRVWAIDASGSYLLRAEHDGYTLTGLTPVFIGFGVLDVVPFDYDGVDGDELAIHYDSGWLLILAWDGELLFSITATNQDRIVASRTQDSTRDLLLWLTYDPGVLAYRIFPFREGQAYDPIDLETQDIRGLVAFDFGSADGEDLVVLHGSSGMLLFERTPITQTAAFDPAPRPVEFGDFNWGPEVDADGGTYADFDGDGDQDLLLYGDDGGAEHVRLWVNAEDEVEASAKVYTDEAEIVIDDDVPLVETAVITFDAGLPAKPGIIGAESHLLFEVWLRPGYALGTQPGRRLRQLVDVSGLAPTDVVPISLEVDVSELSPNSELAVFDVVITLVDADTSGNVSKRYPAYVGQISANADTQALIESQPNPWIGPNTPIDNGTGLSQSGQSGNQQPPGSGPRSPNN